MSDVLNCPECDDMPKMKVMQGSTIIHEDVVCYWRRKKCPSCKLIVKTLEVPADGVHLFLAAPESKDMS